MVHFRTSSYGGAPGPAPLHRAIPPSHPTSGTLYHLSCITAPATAAAAATNITVAAAAANVVPEIFVLPQVSHSRDGGVTPRKPTPLHTSARG